MEIIKLPVGTYQCNCYILKKENNIILIDPGSDFHEINKYLKNNNLLGILVTHNHFDHVGALQDILNNYQTEVYDYHNLKEKTYQIGPFSFEVIYNPGHTADSISFYFPTYKIMFVGDFVFKNSIGRTDLPTGNSNQMKQSINDIKQMAKDIKIYPGHGEITSLEEEFNNNIYFR